MKKPLTLLTALAMLTCAANAQTVDELDWLPDDTVLDGTTFSSPSGEISITTGNSGSGEVYAYNNATNGENFRWRLGDESVKLTFANSIENLSVTMFQFTASGASLSFDLAATSVSSVGKAVLAADKLSITPGANAGGVFSLNWDVLPAGTKSVTLNGVAPSGGRYFGITSVTYTNVPEPSSTALLGLAAMSALMRRRR